MRTILTAAFGWFALCVSGMTCSADEAPAIFILDSTAQMSAKLGQQRKIDAVKSAVNTAASLIAPTAPFALWAFGTNPAKKCGDKRELVPLQAAGSATLVLGKALSSVQPRAARAPAFGTLQAALESLGDAKEAAVSAVLIAGTGDDCTADICSEAKRIHAAHPNAKLTVLGAGMSEQATANFTCAAKVMGGGFTAVKSPTELDRALRQTLGIAPNAKPGKAPAPAPAAQQPPAQSAAAAPENEQEVKPQPAAKPAAPQPEPNIILSAALTTGMPALDAGVTWEVFKITETPTGQRRIAGTPSWTGGGGQARIKLPEGRYFVQVSYGFASATGEFTAGAALAETTISLNAGTVAAEALQAPEGPAADGAFFVLFRRKSAAAMEELGRSSEIPAAFHVNAGDYTLTASAGLAKTSTDVKVEAGKVSAVRMTLNAGTLEIKTFAAEGSQMP
ncbi:MAG: hypothetical protein HY765_09970, partial [Rhodomicrobium sp.]|nr:hypothetical protein [Rhodomicrobium sp.]